MVVPAYPSRKHKHSMSNLFFVLLHLTFSGKFKGSEVQHRIFECLFFGPGIFLGFVGRPRVIIIIIIIIFFFFGGGGGRFLPPFNNPHHLKSEVPMGLFSYSLVLTTIIIIQKGKLVARMFTCL